MDYIFSAYYEIVFKQSINITTAKFCIMVKFRSITDTKKYLI